MPGQAPGGAAHQQRGSAPAQLPEGALRQVLLAPARACTFQRSDLTLWGVRSYPALPPAEGQPSQDGMHFLVRTPLTRHGRSTRKGHARPARPPAARWACPARPPCPEQQQRGVEPNDKHSGLALACHVVPLLWRRPQPYGK